MLTIDRVAYSYPDGTRAVEEVSFTIRPGESVGLIGANGAGKSTLLLTLLGVLMPASGRINVGDIRLSRSTLNQVRQQVGLVFQDPDDQLFTASVYEDVAFGPRNLGFDEAQVAKQVEQALQETGITHLANKAPYRLSGGEKRMAAIASVLSMQPRIVVMDEPSSALDPQSRRRLIGLLQGLTQTRLIASHDLDMVLELCPRVIMLKDGRVHADGPARDLLADEAQLHACGLELPLSLTPHLR